MNTELQPKRRPILFTISLVLAILSALVAVWVIGYSIYQTNQIPTDSLSIKNSNKEDVQTLSDLVNEAPAQTDETQYYSENLDLKFSYDKSLLSLSDQSNNLIFTLNNQDIYQVLARVKVSDKTMNDPISDRSAYYETAYEGVKKDEEGTVETLPYAKLSYAQTNPMDSTQKSIVHKLIIYRQVEDQYIYAEITYPDSFDSTKVASSLAKLLISAELAPEDKDVTNENTTPASTISSTDIEIKKNLLYAAFAKTGVFNTSCTTLSISGDEDWESVNDTTYNPTCQINLGVIYYISSSGKAITNGYTVATNPLDILLNSYWTHPEYQFWIDFKKDLLTYLSNSGVNILSMPDDELFTYVVPVIINLEKDGALTFSTTYENSVEYAQPFEFDQNTALLTNKDLMKEVDEISTPSASMYKYAYEKSAGTSSTTVLPDLTLLQIKDSSSIIFPAVDIDNAKLKSAFSPANITDYLDVNNINPRTSNSSMHFSNAIDYMNIGYYSTAISEFKEVKLGYTADPQIVEVLAKISKSKLSNGEDRLLVSELLPVENFINDTVGVEIRGLNTIILVVSLAVFILSGIIIIIISLLKGKAYRDFKPPVVGNEAVTDTTPVQLPQATPAQPTATANVSPMPQQPPMTQPATPQAPTQTVPQPQTPPVQTPSVDLTSQTPPAPPVAQPSSPTIDLVQPQQQPVTNQPPTPTPENNQ